MMDKPEPIPVKTPVADPIVAILVDPEYQVPPGVLLMRLTLLPAQTDTGPAIVGAGLTVTVVIADMVPQVEVN